MEGGSIRGTESPTRIFSDIGTCQGFKWSICFHKMPSDIFTMNKMGPVHFTSSSGTHFTL